jgi:hypothetical protein
VVIRETKICLNCGKEFSPSYSISKVRWENGYNLCSLKCFHIYRGKQNRKKLAPKVIDLSVNQGLSNVKISEILNISLFLIRRILKENGIEYKEHYLTRHPEKSAFYGKTRSLESIQKGNKTKMENNIGKGENPWNWQGGISGEREYIMATAAYKEFRKSVFERDDYTCQLCNKRGGNLEVHHIKPWRDYPELRFDINNGQTLCVVCHKRIDKYRK